MRNKKYKQTLLDENAYNALVDAKAVIRAKSNRKVTFSDVINEFIKKKVNFLKLDMDIQNYILTFVDQVKQDKNVLGIMLFGSIARGTFNSYSDIDILVVVDGNVLTYFDKLEQIIKEIDPMRQKLVAKGLHLYISEVILKKEDLAEFRPFYISLLEEGTILYEKDGILSEFISNLKKIRYTWVKMGNNLVLEWKE